MEKQQKQLDLIATDRKVIDALWGQGWMRELARCLNFSKSDVEEIADSLWDDAANDSGGDA